ncbi:MAG: hypothetical protein ACTSRW_11535 [Candidatus Helarchaeota archaeon]
MSDNVHPYYSIQLYFLGEEKGDERRIRNRIRKYIRDKPVEYILIAKNSPVIHSNSKLIIRYIAELLKNLNVKYHFDEWTSKEVFERQIPSKKEPKPTAEDASYSKTKMNNIKSLARFTKDLYESFVRIGEKIFVANSEELEKFRDWNYMRKILIEISDEYSSLLSQPIKEMEKLVQDILK